ncbi:uncharacterized protein [Onthophagus taurus]|uniref:uncharacterized protein isoform X2 n=1 Tax=Onthophagus taurus TaxID=166361 RepID=UPI0039BE9FA3
MIITMKAALIGGVAILAIAGITVGIVFATKGGDDDPTCTGFSKPVDLAINERDGKLFAVWGSPENLGDCAPKYNLTLTVNDVVEDAVQVDKNEYEIASKYNKPCVKIHVGITTVDEDNVESEIEEKSYTKAVGDVSEVTTTVKATESDEVYQITWDEPAGYEYCTVTYVVSLNDVAKDLDDDKLSIDIPIDELVTCNNKVTVVPMIETNVAKESEVTISKDVGDVSTVEVTDLEEVLNENIWTISWTKPSGYDNCDVEYIVKIGDGEEKTVTDVSTTISNDDLKKCENTDVVVTPIIQKNSGKATTQQFTADIGDVSSVTVSNLEGTLNNDKTWTISWEKPTGYDNCGIKYILQINDGEGETVNDTPTTISNDDLKKCEGNDITVTPVIQEINGEATTIQINADGGISEAIVTDITSTYNEADSTWTITWTAPTGYETCSPTYLLYIDGTPEETAVSDTSIIIPNTKFIPCQISQIEIEPIFETTTGNEAGQKASGTVEGDIGDVSSVTVSNLEGTPNNDKTWTISWEKPTGYDNCGIKYILQINDGESETVNDTTATISNDDLKKCEENVITVTPVIQEKNGEPATTKITADGGVSEAIVTDITSTYNEADLTWTITWTAPTGYETCSPTYLLYIDGTPEETAVSDTTIIIPNTKFTPCKASQIEIEPVFETATGNEAGQKASGTIEGDIGNVSSVKVANLKGTLNNDKTWTISWEKPTGYDNCGIKYTLKINDGEAETVNDTPATISNDVLKKCEENDIAVTPVIQEKNGEATTIQITGDGGISEAIVTDITSTYNEADSTWTITWTAPTGYETCSPTYLLYIDGTPEETAVSDTTIIIPNTKFTPCKVSQIEIEPVFETATGNEAGQKASGTIEGDIGNVSSVKVTNLEGTFNNDKTWTISWEKPTGYDNCGIKYTLKINDGEGETVNDTPATISNDDLKKCEENDITVTPVIQEKNGEATTIQITGDGGVSEAIVTDITSTYNEADSTWTITWTAPTGYETCSPTYLLYIDGTPEETPVSDTTIIIPNNKFVPCKVSQIEIEPVFGTATGNEAGQKASGTIEGDIGNVSSVKVANLKGTLNNDKTWTISWEKPTGYDNCGIKYTLKINDGEGETVNDTPTMISNDDLKKCEENDITVTPVIQEKNGEATTIQITGDGGVSEAIVTDITSTYNEADSTWTITWTAPTGYETCSPTYLLYIDGTPEETAVSDTTIIIPNTKFTPCKVSQIEIEPVFETATGNEAGQKASGTIEGDIGDVSSVKVANLDGTLNTDKTWTISWEKPTDYDNCDIKYTLKINDGEAETVNDTPATISNDDLKKCEANDITVTPVIQEINGAATTIQINADGGISEAIVTDITSTYNEADSTWTITWTAPTGYETCSPTYLLYIDGTPEETAVSDTTITIPNNKFNPCKVSQIEIEPIFETGTGNEAGQKASGTIKGDIGNVSEVKVSDVTTSYNNAELTWTITWTEPADYEECSPKYLVYIGDVAQEPAVSGKEASIPNAELVQCADNQIHIEPVFEIDGEDKRGEKVTETIRGTVSDVSTVAVQNIKPVLDGDTWTISWDKPADYDQCNIKYVIYFDTEQLGEEVLIEETTIKNAMLTTCVNNNIGVQPRIETELGFKDVTVIKGEPPLDGRITAESFEVKPGGIMDVTWKKADQYQACTFKYNINIKKGDETLFEDSIDEEAYQNTNEEVTNCEGVTATVSATMSVEGEAVSFECKSESALFFLRPK